MYIIYIYNIWGQEYPTPKTFMENLLCQYLNLQHVNASINCKLVGTYMYTCTCSVNLYYICP